MKIKDLNPDDLRDENFVHGGKESRVAFVGANKEFAFLTTGANEKELQERTQTIDRLHERGYTDFARIHDYFVTEENGMWHADKGMQVYPSAILMDRVPGELIPYGPDIGNFVKVTRETDPETAVEEHMKWLEVYKRYLQYFDNMPKEKLERLVEHMVAGMKSGLYIDAHWRNFIDKADGSGIGLIDLHKLQGGEDMKKLLGSKNFGSWAWSNTLLRTTLSQDAPKLNMVRDAEGKESAGNVDIWPERYGEEVSEIRESIIGKVRKSAVSNGVNPISFYAFSKLRKILTPMIKTKYTKGQAVDMVKALQDRML
ncbi:MAG: hypothetical protein FWE16_02820 [Firmicutes bacterium]|nr:hypothetical protein [Bacillota bacterium]